MTFQIDTSLPHLIDLEKEQQNIVQGVVAQIHERILNTNRASPSRPIGPRDAASLDDFTTLVQNAVNDKWRRDGRRGEIFYTEQFPPTDTKLPAIVYRIMRRAPATWSQNDPFEGVKEYRPHLRETAEDTDVPGYGIEVMGQWFDNEVEFGVFASTNKEANELADWFEDLMMEYGWYFAYSGVAKMLYLGRLADQYFREQAVEAPGRSFRFWVRTEKITRLIQKDIEDITVKLLLSAE